MSNSKQSDADVRSKNRRVPAWLKWTFTGFMAVLAPVYWMNYGPTNFLYFCDMALFLTLIAIWTEHPLPASMAAVGILLPQLFWCVDFVCELMGWPLTKMTSYMFNSEFPLFLRSLSLFHGWIPFLLTYLIFKLGYDRRGLKYWTALAVGLCLVAYFFLPHAGAELIDPKTPRNINYVFGFDDTKTQSWLPAGSYLMVWIAALFFMVYLPTHRVLLKLNASRFAEKANPSTLQ